MRRFRKLVTLGWLMVLAGCGADAREDAGQAAVADDAMAAAAAGCAGCHSGPLAFSGRDPAEIAGLISDIGNGRKAHPALNLPAADADSIRRLANALTQH